MSTEEQEMSQPQGSAGLVRGIPSRRIKTAGVLDLRGVPAQEVAQIESIEMAGIILVDEDNRAALGKVPTQLAGTVATAPADLRVIVQPDLEITRSMLEAMSPGQKVMMVGNIYFHPEVPPALAAEKFDDLRLVGILVACEGLLGALFGKVETTGVSVLLPDNVGPVLRSTGQTALTSDYLDRLADGTSYVNIGQTSISAEVSEELLNRKIARYYNVGQTTGPAPLLNLLQSRCSTNLGQFQVAEPAEGAEGAHVENYGKRRISRAFLERLRDGSHYENYGETVIGDDVPEELLARKIARYENYGRTLGPARLVAVLEERCLENYGAFEGAEDAGGSGEGAPAQ